uniref:uncharacterized protein LOC122597795 isoform X2 n=1 Tax=Erigeron canadensis TaxID=72917 RepID=UPI001CB93CC8|nr:uncharacterized protein LOC122597795 isoform X2 [Erigeron canadensis]
MGTLSRSGKYCPIYKPWNKVKDKRKKKLLQLIKTKFDIPEDNVVETWLLQSLGHQVKNWRARLRDLYHDPSLSIKQQKRSRPKQVQKKQWKKLVDYWNEEDFKMLSKKNKDNRGKKKMVQITGKKSYARVREELKESLGKDPSRMDMFHECFCKDGNTKTVEAEKAIVGNEAFLKSILNPTENVAKGWVKSLDPNDIVGGIDWTWMV